MSNLSHRTWLHPPQSHRPQPRTPQPRMPRRGRSRPPGCVRLAAYTRPGVRPIRLGPSRVCPVVLARPRTLGQTSAPVASAWLHTLGWVSSPFALLRSVHLWLGRFTSNPVAIQSVQDAPCWTGPTQHTRWWKRQRRWFWQRRLCLSSPQLLSPQPRSEIPMMRGAHEAGCSQCWRAKGQGAMPSCPLSQAPSTRACRTRHGIAGKPIWNFS